jgi:hypothetical protein
MNSPNFLRTHFLSRSNSIDDLGVFASTLCAMHCAVMPLIIGALPLLGLEVFAAKRTEWFFVVMSVVLGILSLVPSYLRRHRRSWPLILFIIGVGLILSARLSFEDTIRAEIPLVVMGALLVAGSHFLNRRLCRSCPVCPADSG